jgi:hypothetical protein
MKSYIDSLYGEEIIEEPVILALLNSSSLQRLKGIDQAGYPPLHPERKTVNRFVHSVGVYLLLKRFGASLEEQIMGLIHDVSHGCFSHCLDYVLKDDGLEKSQSLQDNCFDAFIKNSEIEEIIQYYGFDLDFILKQKNSFLLERELPDLCADRIDYSIRDALCCGIINKSEKDLMLNNLKIDKDRWFFQNFEIAQKYAEIFLKMNQKYANFGAAKMFRIIGDFLIYALEKAYIERADLYTTDKEVIDKIRTFVGSDKCLALLWQRMQNQVKVINNPDNYDARVFCKSRIVDPLFKENSHIKRISEVNRDWKEVVEQELKPKTYFLKFL